MKVIRALGQLQSSPNTFIPVHMHLRSQSQMKSQVCDHMTIWHLPEEVLMYLLKGLHIKDILNMRTVHPYFRDLIDSNVSLWSTASFDDSWPSAANLCYFEKAAEIGNIEALIKLAVAYLYNEGLPGDFEGHKVTSNGVKAAEMFCKIENLTMHTDPFIWLFIRPPWSASGACCKECVFNYMKEYLQTTADKSVQVCVAKTMLLLEDDRQTQAMEHLRNATEIGSGVGSYLHWQLTHANKVPDRAQELEQIRQLRDIVKLEHLDAKLTLCKYYALGKYGGISRKQAAIFVSDFIRSMSPNRNDSLKTTKELTSSMRYILIDWLVEVAGMKDFSSQTLHVAVSVVDRYLKLHQTTRSKLQLLGVAAMVLCSRFLGKDIITIREAAWLTDNTYKYEDVVRMMGEITATLRGNIRVPTSLDFVEVFSVLASLDKKTSCLAEYICELSLLQTEMSQYCPTEISASAVFLSKLLMKHNGEAWSKQMQEFTGFSIEDLSRCAFHMHEKCFLEGSVVDHRDVTLQAVKQRYADEKFCSVSDMEIISYEELCVLLGVTEHIMQGADVRVKFRNEDELIVSPSRGKRKRFVHEHSLRDNAATPTLDNNSFLNESLLSGYDGDKEDADESFQEYDECMETEDEDILGGEMGSESDTYFASLSSANRSARMMTLNLSFLTASPSTNFGFSFGKSNSILSDDSSSGVSSSPSVSKDNDWLKPCDSLVAGTSRTSNDSEMASDSEINISSASLRLRKSPSSVKHMTVKSAQKRKCRKQLGGASKAFILQ